MADGVAAIGYASVDVPGAIKIGPAYGTTRLGNNKVGYQLGVLCASESDINRRLSSFKPIAPSVLDVSVKSAMCDGKGTAWTDAERLAALDRMGCTVCDDGTVKFTAQET